MRAEQHLRLLFEWRNMFYGRGWIDGLDIALAPTFWRDAPP